MKMETPLKTTAAYVIAGAASPDFRNGNDRQGHERRFEARYGRHLAGWRRWPHHSADVTGREDTTAHRS
jgi:hypothetical protein